MCGFPSSLPHQSGRKLAGLVTEPVKLAVSDYLAEWLRSTVTLENRPSTLRRYASLTRTHIIPALGQLRLTALKPAHLQRLYADMTAAGLSSSTVKGVHAVLHRALSRAVEWNYLPRNPADSVKPPAGRQAEMMALTREQTGRLIETAESCGDRWAPLWRLLVDAGLRIGEALALTWNDLGLERARVTVTKTLVLHADGKDGAPVMGEPKNSRSRRMVPIAPATVRALCAHHARQSAERLALGPDYAAHGLVFSTRVGIVARYQRINEALRETLAAAELPRVRIHDLRHTAATLMLQANIPSKIVAERLGHSSIAITLDRYSHVTPGMQEDAVQRLATAMGWQ